MNDYLTLFLLIFVGLPLSAYLGWKLADLVHWIIDNRGES